MDKFWENYIKTRPADSKGAFDAFKKMHQEPRTMAQGSRTGFKDGNGVYDEKELLGKRVRELMDEGYEFGEAVKQAMKEGYAEGGRIGFGDGSPGTPRYIINPKNVDLEFKPDPKKVKLYKKATWDKIYQYKKAIEKLITDFEKTKILSNEKFEITTDKIAKLLNLKKGAAKDNQIKHAVSLIDSKKFPHIITKRTQIQQTGEPLKSQALTEQQKTYFKKNYKNIGISQMARHFSKLPAKNKKTLALKAAFDRFKNTLVTKGFINTKDVYMQTTQPGTGYKIKDYNAWSVYEAQRNRLADLDPETWMQEKYIGTKGKYKGKFAPYKLDSELLRFLNLNMLRGALHEKWPKHLLPSLEHITGITAADIIGDSEGLRKVEANTRRWNFKETGAKSNLYKDVKAYLKTAKSAFAKGMTTEGNEALKTVNQLYDKSAERFNLNRKKFPFYKWQGGKIAEVNVKGVIKQGTVSEAFLEFFKNVVRDATPSEMEKIKKIQPSIHKVLIEIKNGNTAKAKELIKVNVSSKGYVPGKHTSSLFNFAGGIDSSMFPNIEISPKLTNALSKAGNVVKGAGKVLGPASLVLDVIPFAQARDLGIDDWGKVGGKNLAQEYLNLPRTIEDLFHVAGEGTWKDFGSKKEEDRLFKYKPRTFGTKATVKALRETSAEDLIARINAQGEAAQSTDVAYGQQLLDPLVSEEEINKRIEKALKQKEWADSLPPDHELVREEKKEKTIDPFASIFDPIPKMEFAGGGMARIRRPSAIPPESGPQSQGLASLKKYGSYY